jgi:phosphatidylinositol alpha-1,6-mannosyltransferase
MRSATRAQRIPRVFLGAATLAAGQGGIARVARMSARALIEAGYEVDLASFLDQTQLSFCGRQVATSFASKLAFAARVHLAAPTHIHFLYDSVGIARAHPRLPGLKSPYAVWMHGLEVYEGMRPDYGRAINRASMVLVNSRYTLERHEACHGSLANRRVCWLATEQDACPAVKPDFSGVPSVLIIGRLEAQEGWKGHDELLACWPDVVAAVPDARLVIAGGGTGLARMRDRARHSSATNNIDVLGFVPEHELPALFKRAHVFAMPSKQEGFGIVYIEAMRYGLPVIASVHDAGQEVNADGVTGFNVDLSRKDDLLDKLIYLLRNTNRAFAMGQAGFERWQQNFRYGCFAERFIQCWQEFRTATTDVVPLGGQQGEFDASR